MKIFKKLEILELLHILMLEKLQQLKECFIILVLSLSLEKLNIYTKGASWQYQNGFSSIRKGKRYNNISCKYFVQLE